MPQAKRVTARRAIVVMLVVVALAAVPLWRLWVDNRIALRMLAAMPVLADTTTFWRGAGLRSGGEELAVLTARAYQASPAREGCSDYERTVLADAVSLLDGWPPRGRMAKLAAARHLECADKPNDALGLLDAASSPDSFDLQRVSLLQRLGAHDRAASIVLRYACTSREPWCLWSVLGVAPVDAVIWRHANDTGSVGGPVPPRRIAPLDVRTIHNVTVRRGAPLIVTGAVPLSERDNYVEYERLPVSNGTVRFRIRGAVAGGEESCLHPRLILWSSEKYDGEIELPYPVRGLFEVDLWGGIPARVTAVTPRLTFDSTCLTGGRTIALGAAELAVTGPAAGAGG